MFHLNVMKSHVFFSAEKKRLLLDDSDAHVANIL